MHSPPYIGITGITLPSEVAWLQEVLDSLQERWPADYRFMNGVLLSRKTLVGEPASDPKQYPLLDEVASLLPSDPRFYNVAHFNSRDPRLCDQLMYLDEKAGLNLHAIQVNMPWPEVSELERYRARDGKRIILQIGKDAFAQIDHRPEWLAYRLAPYVGAVDHALIDLSGGEGVNIDPEFACRAVEAIADFTHSGIRVGVAGGLSEETVGSVSDILKVYDELSWDAQGKMRAGNAANLLDPLRCIGFLRASCDLFV